MSDWKKLLSHVSSGRLCRSACWFPEARQCPNGIVTALVEYLRPFLQPCEISEITPQRENGAGTSAKGPADADAWNKQS